LRVPAPKEGPPYKIGDIIGYSEEGLEELYVGKVVLFAKWGNIYFYDFSKKETEKALHKYKPILIRKENNPSEVGLAKENFLNNQGKIITLYGGPYSFSIDKEGNFICILDMHNARIQKWHIRKGHILNKHQKFQLFYKYFRKN
jgi:hypothetical protein